MAPFLMTLSDLQGHSPILQVFSNAIFHTVVQKVIKVQLT